jgi:hypothetical protein
MLHDSALKLRFWKVGEVINGFGVAVYEMESFFVNFGNKTITSINTMYIVI